jgi:glycosyltransferase involved in cell wall biosynthesis
MQPTINYIATLLIPVKGNLHYLGETIDSILSQTITNFSVLFIDDGVDQHSLDWLLRCVSKYDNFKVLKSPGNGISDALNFGIENSDTEYIIRMDSDDIMLG